MTITHTRKNGTHDFSSWPQFKLFGFADGYAGFPWDGPERKSNLAPGKSDPDRKLYSDGYVLGQVDRNMGR